MLLLELGQINDKLVCLVNDLIPKQDINTIRHNVTKFEGMNIEERVKWLKDECPAAMRACRTLKKDYVVVLNTYNIKSLES